MVDASRSVERERWFLLADIGCVLYLGRDVKERSK